MCRSLCKLAKSFYIVIEKSVMDMTLSERTVLIKESLKHMPQDDFNLMLERNGHEKIKEMENTIFFKALSPVCETEKKANLYLLYQIQGGKNYE